MHQEAYSTLVDFNETVPETKKVTDFLAGISDPRLSNAKDPLLVDISSPAVLASVVGYTCWDLNIYTNSPLSPMLMDLNVTLLCASFSPPGYIALITL